MIRTISGVHKIFDTSQFKSIRKRIIQEAQELRESMERGLEEDEELVDDDFVEDLVDLTDTEGF